jgi:MOSC domain-containing protein YiiM
MGTVESIHLADRASAPVHGVDEVAAHAGLGLAGDRYFTMTGTFKKSEPKRQVTLIEAEAFDALVRDYDIEMDPGDARRNIVTRGVALNHLVGREFSVGEVRLRGLKLCEPCSHMEKLAGKPVREPLRHRGGLRAEILTSGTIKVGDVVSVSDHA